MIINQPDELLDGMSDWCKEHHGKVDTHLKLRQTVSLSIWFVFFLMNWSILSSIHSGISMNGVILAALFYYFICLYQSGLTQAVQNSKMTLEQAEYEFLSFVRQHTPPGQCPLAGKFNPHCNYS